MYCQAIFRIQCTKKFIFTAFFFLVDLPQLEDYISSIQQKLNSQEISKELFQEPFQEIQVKLHGHYTEFVKIHNVKSSKSSALAKIQKKILSE